MTGCDRKQHAGVNVHIYPSSFKNESRILKITKSIANSNIFEKIYIMAMSEEGLPFIEQLDESRIVIRIDQKIANGNAKILNKAFKMILWGWRLKHFLETENISCVNCHSLSVLPLSALLRILKKAKLIYDTHELETESIGSKGIRKHLSKIMERMLMPFIDEVVVVNDDIAKWYKKEYALKRIWVVKNVPYREDGNIGNSSVFRDLYNIKDNEMIFLYQGVIGRGRGIKILLEIFSRLAVDKHVVFLGYGPLIESVMEYERKYQNIHYHKAVKPEEINYYAKGADVGLSIIENLCLSYYLCLPNKVFEYVNCGLPVVVSDFPVMAKFVDEYSCGWKVAVNVEKIRSIIESITWEVIREKKEKAIQARGTFGWHKEEAILLTIYQSLGFSF